MKVPRLEHSMRANAVFSASSGTAAIAAGVIARRPFGLESWLLVVVGTGLLVYAVELAVWSRRPRSVVPGARLATIADGAWVLGAVIVLVGFPTALDTSGRVVLGLVTLAVAELAVLQYLGLRSASTARSIVEQM